MTTHVGIDPGKHGAIAAINADGQLLHYENLPDRGDGEIDVTMFYSTLQALQERSNGFHVSIERAQTMPKQGIVGAFRYGEHNGKILAVMELMLAVEHRHYPRPQTWKPIVPYGSAKEDTERWVKELHPELCASSKSLPRNKQKREGICDAIAIAHWSRANHI